MIKSDLAGKHLLVVFWNLGIGGIQTRIKDIVSDTICRGGRVTILVERRSSEEIDLVSSNYIKIENFRNDKYEELKRPFKRFERFRFLFWIIYRVYLLKPSNVLVFLNRFSVFLVITRLILFFLGIRFRLILNEGILTSKYLKQYEHPLWNYLVKWAYPKSDLIIVATKAVKNDLVVNYNVPPGKIKIIPSWVDIEISSNIKKFDGIFVGRLSEEKGIRTLVKLAKRCKKIKRFKVAIVGDGAMKNWLIKEISLYKLNDYLKYLGYQPHNLVLKFISESKLLLLPSRNEGLPMTVLESYAVKVPAAVMPFDGAEEVVLNGKTGIISSMNDNDYCDKVIELLNNPKKINLLGVKAKQAVAKYHSKKNLKEFVDCVFNID